MTHKEIKPLWLTIKKRMQLPLLEKQVSSVMVPYVSTGRPVLMQSELTAHFEDPQNTPLSERASISLHVVISRFVDNFRDGSAAS